MNSELNQKISISLPPNLVKYTEQYQKETGLSSRSEVIVKALKALRREQLIESYKQAAEDHRLKPDPFEEIGLNDGLEPSTEETW